MLLAFLLKHETNPSSTHINIRDVLGSATCDNVTQKNVEMCEETVVTTVAAWQVCICTLYCLLVRPVSQ